MTAYTPKTLNTFQQQYVRCATSPFMFNDPVTLAGGFNQTMTFPPGAIIIGGALNVITAFDTGTTATVSVGTSGSPAVTLAATDIKTVASTAITVPAAVTTELNLGLTFTSVGTVPTAGEAVVYINYIMPYGADFSVGDDASVNL